MTQPTALLRRPRLILGVLAPLALLGCADGPEAIDATARVSHEAVQRYHTAVLLRTQPLDAQIAAIEAEAATADSAEAIVLQQTITALHEERAAIQRGLDSLDGQPVEVFETATQAIDGQLDALANRLGVVDSSDAARPLETN